MVRVEECGAQQSCSAAIIDGGGGVFFLRGSRSSLSHRLFCGHVKVRPNRLSLSHTYVSGQAGAYLIAADDSSAGLGRAGNGSVQLPPGCKATVPV